MSQQASVNHKLLLVLVGLCCTQIQADNVLDLIEPNNQILSGGPSTTLDQCHLTTQSQLKPLLEAAAAADADNNNSYPPETKYILIKRGSTKDGFVDELRQAIASLGYKVCTVDSDADQMVSTNISIVVQRGHRTPYYGRHDPSTLIRYISTIEQRLAQSPYQTIESKLDKKAYEHVLEPKIVAYFPDITAPGFQEFQRAARMISPNPPFYVVHNPQFASKFRLNQPGQISLVRRLEKSQIFFPSSPPPTAATVPKAEEIIDWINANRGLILHELKDFNLYDPELQDLNKYQLVAVGDKASPLGLYFFKILTKTIQNISRQNEMKLNPMVSFDNDNDYEEVPPVKAEPAVKPEVAGPDDQLIRLDDIEIVWIDSSQFPNAVLNMKNRYQIPSFKNVWFGLIHAPSNASVVKGLQSVWFGMDTLNLTRSDRQTDEENIRMVRDWIMTVTDRKPDLESNPLDGMIGNVFELEPEPVSARKGGNFLLECKVNPGNSCRWQKNLEPVTVDGTRLRSVQSANHHDCSIMINGANELLDAGQWICVATDQNGQPIQSRSVMVTVRDSQTKSEL